jgi:hypothetical protein
MVVPILNGSRDSGTDPYLFRKIIAAFRLVPASSTKDCGLLVNSSVSFEAIQVQRDERNPGSGILPDLTM